jgi:ribosomal protein S12
VEVELKIYPEFTYRVMRGKLDFTGKEKIERTQKRSKYATKRPEASSSDN